MGTRISAIAAAPEIGVAPPSSSDPAAPRAAAPVERAPDPVEMRLVIEQDQASGAFVYKTINRVTGEVIQQLPRAEVLKLRQRPHYATGSVIRTKA